MIRESIQKLVDGVDLTHDESTFAMKEIMSGQATNAQIGAFLTALRTKGETTEEITALVSDAGKKYSLILSIMKDTGMRPIEIERTKMKWIDLNRGTINVETAKHGNGRTLKLKNSTLVMLKEYIGKNNFNLNDDITGVDKQISEDVRGGKVKAGKYPEKY